MSGLAGCAGDQGYLPSKEQVHMATGGPARPTAEPRRPPGSCLSRALTTRSATDQQVAWEAAPRGG